MAHQFGALVFTPVVKALQERYGSRRQYARLEASASPDRLGTREREFIADQDHFYMATVGATGWPYIQHRGGPKGFLRVRDDARLAFADFSGNKQFITAGNITTDDRAALILVDYARQERLKILGRGTVLDGRPAAALISQVRDASDKAVVERVFVIQVEAFDWNCPQHITPRYTSDEIQTAVHDMEERLRALADENASLRREVERLRSVQS